MASEKKIRECVNGLLEHIAHPADVAGPALTVLLTDLAVADSMSVETLIRTIREQFPHSTGKLFRAAWQK